MLELNCEFAGKLIELSAESHGDGRRDKGCCMIFDYGDCRELLVVILVDDDVKLKLLLNREWNGKQPTQSGAHGVQ